MIQIQKAETSKDVIAIANLGFVIWQEHYTSIIGEEQVKYMLNKFQTAEAIKDQINKGYDYFIIKNDQSPIGYFACENQKRSLFLSKIYILKDFRGKGIGKRCLNFIIQKGVESGLPYISLSVNKYNENSIQFYIKYGFKKVDAQIKDIGDGYVMDDFIMEKKI